MTMKNISKLFFVLAMSISLSSCYEEFNPNDDLFDAQGNTAYVTALTANPILVDAGQTTTLTLKCYAVGVDMKEVIIYDRIGTTAAYTQKEKIAFKPNFVEAEKLHVVTVPYTAPNTKNATLNIQVEVVTSNNLASRRNRTLTIRTRP
jgi:hypothetical protein